jgi:hypothetical protein
MRSLSEIAHRSPESERNSAEQHRPPSIRQSFSHGDVCFYQSSPLFRFSFFFLLNRFSLKFTFWQFLRLNSRYFPPKSEWIVIFGVFSTKCSENCRLSSILTFNSLFSYRINSKILFLIVSRSHFRHFSAIDGNFHQILIKFTVFATFSLKLVEKVCISRIPCFNTWSWNFHSIFLTSFVFLCVCVCIIVPRKTLQGQRKSQEIRQISLVKSYFFLTEAKWHVRKRRRKKKLILDSKMIDFFSPFHIEVSLKKFSRSQCCKRCEMSATPKGMQVACSYSNSAENGKLNGRILSFFQKYTSNSSRVLFVY